MKPPEAWNKTQSVLIGETLFHVCSICNKKEPWNQRWSTYGSFEEWDEGMPLFRFCSDECRSVFDPERLPVEYESVEVEIKVSIQLYREKGKKPIPVSEYEESLNSQLEKKIVSWVNSRKFEIIDEMEIISTSITEVPAEEGVF